MAIDISVQHNGGFLPGIILLIQWFYHEGNLFKCHEEVLSLQPIIPPTKRFDIFFPLTGRCSEGPDAFRFSFKIGAWVNSKMSRRNSFAVTTSQP